MNQAWQLSDTFVGSGECFVFTLRPSLRVFPWTGKNNYLMHGKKDGVVVGGGQDGQAALWLDADFERGNRCVENFVGRNEMSL